MLKFLKILSFNWLLISSFSSVFERNSLSSLNVEDIICCHCFACIWGKGGIIGKSVKHIIMPSTLIAFHFN